MKPTINAQLSNNFELISNAGKSLNRLAGCICLQILLVPLLIVTVENSVVFAIVAILSILFAVLCLIFLFQTSRSLMEVSTVIYDKVIPKAD